MNAQEREAFWKTLCALPGLDLSQDAKQLMAAIRFPKLLFRYRPVNLNSLEALRTNRLYFSSANYYDDPFDTFLHIDIDSIHQELLTAFQERNPEQIATQALDVTQKDAVLKLNGLIEQLGGMDLFLLCSGIGKQNRDLQPEIFLVLRLHCEMR